METVQGLVVKTVCRTVDEFIERYYRRASSRLGTLFVGAIEPRALAADCAFVVLLADRTVVMAGVCEVLDIYPHARNPYGCAGMRLAMKRLSPESREVWSRLCARGEADGTISSQDLSHVLVEFEEETTAPRDRALLN